MSIDYNNENKQINTIKRERDDMTEGILKKIKQLPLLPEPAKELIEEYSLDMEGFDKAIENA